MQVEQLSPGELPDYNWGTKMSYRKSEYACMEAIRHLCGASCTSRRYEEHFPYIAVISLTFQIPLEDCKEAKKIIDQILKTLKRRYRDELYRPGHKFTYVWCQERQQSGRIHFHLAMEMPFNTREGTNVEMLNDWDYIQQSPFARDRIENSLQFLNEALQKESEELSSVLSPYGVGLFELWPIHQDANSLADYISKGVTRQFRCRDPKDRGARLWGCSNHVRIVNTKFTFLTEESKAFRKKLEIWATTQGCSDYGDLSTKFGSSWFLKYRALINQIKLIPDDLS